MRFYRVHYLVDNGSSGGYEFFTSAREAQQAKRKHDKALREWNAEHDIGPEHDIDKAEIEEIKVKPDKYGILRTLNIYASHPNNG
jgi:hypothetical protein